jgi:hypothetical protein
MSWRFYRRVRLAPGLTLNLSKRGVSASVGVRGAHVTVGRSGVRETVGLPGTGLSYTEQQQWSGLTAPPSTPRTGPSLGTILLILVVLFVLAAVFGAHGQTLTCEASGDRTHCWDSRTGALVETTEHGAGGYSHSWGKAGDFTTWDRPGGRSETWRTR